MDTGLQSACGVSDHVLLTVTGAFTIHAHSFIRFWCPISSFYSSFILGFFLFFGGRVPVLSIPCTLQGYPKAVAAITARMALIQEQHLQHAHPGVATSGLEEVLDDPVLGPMTAADGVQ